MPRNEEYTLIYDKDKSIGGIGLKDPSGKTIKTLVDFKNMDKAMGFELTMKLINKCTKSMEKFYDLKNEYEGHK